MNLIEIIFLTGAHCISPLHSGVGVTEAGKVACAVVVKQNPDTSVVELFPPHTATNPDVIAVLGKSIAHPAAPLPLAEVVPASSSEDTALRLTGDEEIMRQAPKRVAVPPALVRKVKRQKSQDSVGLAVTHKKTTARKLRDQCGSYRAVWYTNKDGRRKYRCVRG